MATKTSLLGLTKPAYTEAADIAVLNTNFDLIDSAIGRGARAANLLDNSYFLSAYVINQRGQTTATHGQYFIDRWRAEANNETTTITIGSDGLTLTPTATHQVGIFQNLPDYTSRKGITHTIAICVNNTWYCHSFSLGNLGGGHMFDNGINFFSVDGQHILFRARPGYDPVTIQRVALYEGAYDVDTLPACQYKGYAAELAECMRYYQVGGKKRMIRKTAGSGALPVSERFPIPMRITPTVTSTYIAWSKLEDNALVVEQTTKFTVFESSANSFLGYYSSSLLSVELLADWSYVASADL